MNASPDTLPVPETAAEAIAQCREQGLAEPEKVARMSWPELFELYSSTELFELYALSDAELIDYCGDDARRWAEAFCRIKERQGWSPDDIDEGLMIGWFANAIEKSSDVRAARKTGGAS